MRLTILPAGLLALFMGWSGVGCQTAPMSPAARRPAHGPHYIPQKQQAFAEALALFSQGLIHEMHKEFDAALANYRQAIELDPDNEELYFRLAMGLLHQRRNDDAVAIMERLVEWKPESTKALRWLALIYRAADQPVKSEATYDQWIRLAPDDPAPYIQLASLYVRADRDEEALAMLHRALDKVDSPTDLLRAMADIYIQRSSVSLTEDDEKVNREEAIRVYEQILLAEPDDPFTLNKLGELYIQNEEIDKAISFYEHMGEEYPENLRVKEKLAESFLAIGEKEKAVAVLETIAEQQPANPRVHFYLGELYQELGDTSSAAESFGKAIEAEPDQPSGYLKLAVLKMTEDAEGAVAVLLEGLDRLPEDETLTKTLAHVYFSQRDYVRATEYFAKALKLIEEEGATPVNASFYFNYAVAAQRADMLDDAAHFLARAIDDNLAFMDAFVQFVFRQEGDEDKERGIEVLKRIAEQRPTEPRATYYLGLLNNYLKNYQDAILDFEHTVELAEESGDVTDLLSAQFYFWYAAACERDGQFERSEELFDKCLSLNPEHAEAFNYVAYMWAERGVNLDKAKEYVEKALSIVPDSGAFVDTLGWIYYMQGDYDAALNEIERAVSMLPDDATVIDHLGDVLLKLGEVDQALPKWKRSFVLDPDNEKVADKLSRHGVDLAPLRDEAAELQVIQEPADTALDTTGEPLPDDDVNEPVAAEEEAGEESVDEAIPVGPSVPGDLESMPDEE